MLDERARQWLLWIGRLYQGILESGAPSDLYLANCMRRQGRQWGHDARRWVSSAVYAMVRQRPRTLWFWALALRENTDLLDKIKHLSLCFRPAPDSSPPPSENPPAYSLPRTQLALLDIEAAARAQLFPSAALPPPGVLEALRPPPRLPEAVVAWAARRRGGPLDILLESMREWTGPVESFAAAAALAEGAGRPWDPDLTRALLEFSDSLRAAPPGAGQPDCEIAWNGALPLWLVQRWIHALGAAETRALAARLERPAPIYLRVNTLKSTPEEVLRRLRAEGHLAGPVEAAPGALLLVHRANLYRSAAFAEGLFEIQDVSSQAAGYALDPRPGERVLDFCAGAGGKTLHLAALMQNKGTLWALDVEARRLARLKQRAARAGAYNIRRALVEPVPVDADTDADAAFAEPSARGEFASDPRRLAAWLTRERFGSVGDFTESVSRIPPVPFQESTAMASEEEDLREIMRQALGLDSPAPPGAGEELAAGGEGPEGAKPLLAPRDLPEPTEKEIQALRDALAHLPSDFNAVLVDAPCSGSGALRRHPDAVWRLSPGVIRVHCAEQAAILRAAAARVEPGGRLLYVTCSLLPEENEAIIEAFLEEFRDFEPGDLSAPLRRHGFGAFAPPPGAPWTTLLPTRGAGDGFFLALLRRKGEGAAQEMK